MVTGSLNHGRWQPAYATSRTFLLRAIPVREGVQRLLLDWSYALRGRVQEGTHLTHLLYSIATVHFFPAAIAIRETRGHFFVGMMQCAVDDGPPLDHLPNCLRKIVEYLRQIVLEPMADA